MKPRLSLRKPGSRKPYVWQHAADWDRDGWNGVSYTGNEPAMIRMRFEVKRPSNARRLGGKINRWMRRSMKRTYRGQELRRMLSLI